MHARTRAPALTQALRTTCVSLAAAGLMGGCSDGGYYEAAAVGDAVMDWTIDGTADPDQCTRFGATTFDVSLYDSAGQFYGEYEQDCTSFATTIEGLDPDTYTAQATLLDAGGLARSTTVDLQPFDVLADEAISLSLDFPADSFY